MTAGENDLVYKNYTQDQLDREYDNIRKVEGFDFSTYMSELKKANEQAKNNYKDILLENLQYGPTADEVLDLFIVNPGGPLHVFFHGGYWRMLHKNDFSYVANGVLPHGHNLAIINYSLIPTVTMEELVTQCVRSVKWLMQKAHHYGFDPLAVSVSGHSAGGHLAAMMATYTFEHALTSICALSGIFDLEPIRLCFLNKTLSLTDNDIKVFSPSKKDPISSTKIRIVTGDREGDEYFSQAKELEKSWHSKVQGLNVIFAQNHDHFTLRKELNNPNSEITNLTLFS